jgi:copper resistance protein B
VHHQSQTPPQKPKPAPPTGHEGHDMPQTRPPDLPPITDEDRRAAFPDVDGHTVHDRAWHSLVLFDQLEWQSGSHRRLSWDTKGWIGGDRNRFRFRTEGERERNSLRAGQVHALYSRSIARWWDVVAGLRQDLRPGPTQTWLAVGLQGLAPQWIELEATAYVGAAGRTHFRIEAEYELLLTNRLVLQPLAEMEIYGKDDLEHGFAAGLSTAEVGLRLRYEIRRELAPYLGLTWDGKLFGTGDLARQSGEPTSAARVAFGLRTWF